MSIGTLLLLFLAGCSQIYHLLAAFCAVLFIFRRRKLQLHASSPKVACLKPLCGYDFETSLNLDSFLHQDYPDYEVIFGTASREDSAYAVAESVCKRYPEKSARVVCGEIGNGANRKIRNIRNIESQISSDAEILILSDSDIRVSGDYIKNLVSLITDHKDIGCVTCLYRMENIVSLGCLMEALSVESSFAPGVLVSSTFTSSLNYAFGATIAVKKADFIQSGGFEAVEEFLADDYKIGNNIASTGKRVLLSPYPVSIVLPKQNLSSTWQHLARWNGTVRICNPIGYIFFIITNSTLWTSLAFVSLGISSWTGLALICESILMRWFTASIVIFSLQAGKGTLRAFLTPFWEIFAFFLWAAGLFKNEVQWRGIHYKIGKDGRMVEIVHKAEQ